MTSSGSWNAGNFNLIRIAFAFITLACFCEQVFGFAVTQPLTRTRVAKRLDTRDDNVWTLSTRTQPTLADIPSLDRLRQAVKDEAENIASMSGIEPEDLTTIFYTNNPLPVDEIECWAAKFLGEDKFVTFENAISPDDSNNFLKKVIGKGAAKDLYQKQLSRVIAEQAEGDVILLIPTGVDPKPQSTWMLYEFPALQHSNPNVVSVYRVDPTGKVEPVLLWETGDEKTLPPPLDTLPPGP